MKFLGHVVSEKGIQADPDKTKAFSEMKKPKSVPELRRSMGMVNHLADASSHGLGAVCNSRIPSGER